MRDFFLLKRCIFLTLLAFKECVQRATQMSQPWQTSIEGTLLTYPLEPPAALQVSLHQRDAVSACQSTRLGRDTQPYPECETEIICHTMLNNEYNTNSEDKVNQGNNVYNVLTPEQESTVLLSICRIYLERRNPQEHHTCHAWEYFRQSDAYWPMHHEHRRSMNTTTAGDMCCHQCIYHAAWP